MLNAKIEEVRPYFPSKDLVVSNGISIYNVCPKCKKDYNECDCVCYKEDYEEAGLPW